MPGWRLIPGAAPVIHSWDGDYVVFAPLSGDTHILDITGGEVLQALLAGPETADSIHRRLAALLELPADATLAEQVDGMLENLDELGLIERTD